MKEMLSCHTLDTFVRDCFSKIEDISKRTCSIKLKDVLMSGYAVFSLKFPSLIQFDTSISEKEHTICFPDRPNSFECSNA
jgi:hypothetical protein